MPPGLLLQLGLAVLAAVVGMALVYGIAPLRRRPAAAASPAAGADDTSFLFEGCALVDATPPARRMLQGGGGGGAEGRTDLDRLVLQLERLYPGFADALPAEGAAPGRIRVPGRLGESGLELEWWDGRLRVAVTEETESFAPVHPVTLGAMEEDIALLKLISEETPELIWRSDAEGRITWANRSYLDLADRVLAARGEPAGLWPPPALFEPPPASGPDPRRISLDTPAGIRWFDLHVRQTPPDTLSIATPADAAIASERHAQDFLDMMSRIFAELSVGMLIFDNERRLAMYNPAALEMFGLEAGYLSARPPIRAVLDRLRERGRIPESRDYRTWREQIAALQSASESGQLSETWSLPGGQTWRVTGRPQPGGALALLFEDISDEIGLTRRYRSELETGRAVLDALPDAIAVFSSTGTLRMTNGRYAELWGQSADGLGDLRLKDEISGWAARCAPTGLWSAFEGGDPVAALGGEPAGIRRRDGRAAEMRLSRLGRGDILVRLRLIEPVEPAGRHPGHDVDAAPDLVFRRSAGGS